MQSASTHRPSPALIVALIALVAALAGTATALPGKGSVDKNDLKKGAVTKKAIKKKAVTTKALADGAVTAPKIAAGEAPHVVGAPGEPPFGNGGEGDCEWRNATPSDGIDGANPAAFYKDQLGFAHLEGFLISDDAPGGDGVCDTSDAGELEDGIAFTLPPGYAPSGLILTASLLNLIAIVPSGGASFEGTPLPGGSVFGSDMAILEPMSYRPGPAAPADAPVAKLDLDRFERLLR